MNNGKAGIGIIAGIILLLPVPLLLTNGSWRLNCGWVKSLIQSTIPVCIFAGL